LARFTLSVQEVRCECGSVTPSQELHASIPDEDAYQIQALEEAGKVKVEISENGKRITWVNTEKDSIITTALFEEQMHGHPPDQGLAKV
jgi:hypothetical protein